MKVRRRLREGTEEGEQGKVMGVGEEGKPPWRSGERVVRVGVMGIETGLSLCLSGDKSVRERESVFVLTSYLTSLNQLGVVFQAGGDYCFCGDAGAPY